MVQESSRVISILNTGYIICLVLTIVFFLISILLFIVFDIKHTFLVLTGRAAKKEIKKLEEENFNTGRLRRYQHPHNYGDSGAFSSSEDFGKTETMADVPDTSQYAQQNQPEYSPAQYDNQSNDSNATTILGQSDTTVLNANGAQTTVLNAELTTVLNADMRSTVHQNRKFDITKKEMLIHTEEVI